MNNSVKRQLWTFSAVKIIYYDVTNVCRYKCDACMEKYEDAGLEALRTIGVNAAGVAGVTTPQYLTCRSRLVLTTPPPIF